MTTDLRMLLFSVILFFVVVLLPTVIRVKGWTPEGLKLLFGNRDDLPEPSPLAARADRTAKNMYEGMLMFIPAVLLARVAGVADADTALGAQLFFYARLVYVPVFYAGIPYLRTGVWTVSIIGIVMMLVQLP